MEQLLDEGLSRIAVADPVHGKWLTGISPSYILAFGIKRRGTNQQAAHRTTKSLP
jgi:hypothetical protein